ncbi:MAG: hypothetical protein CMF50_07785 [Legionellales bacterium]|nr:hypothetical protein [Legionellales bacterium]|tara:strand:- start:13843 stop:14658 length:816 start_codon:yes stop_codon:yes gene_type:complete
MKPEQFFYDHPVFRHEEFAAWKAEQGDIKATSINGALRYYVKTGRITPIRRKLYAAVPPNQSVDDVIVDPYLIAGKATEDAIVGYHSALEMMGVAYSTFGQFTYATVQKSKLFTFQDRWFQPVSQPTSLQKKQSTSFGVEVVNRQGLPLRVTNSARTYVDVLDRIELAGGWEEVCRSIQKFSVLNIDEVIEYCFMLGNTRLNATVGYFLSQREGAFAVSDSQLKPLLNAIPRVPQHASKRSKEKYQLVKPWNILLPVSVVNQLWEEPDVDV